MSPHLSETQVQLFSTGDMAEAAAIPLAEHLDQCAHCATQVAQADPLASAFAEMQDPEVPEDLVDEILARAADRPQEHRASLSLKPEIWAAVGLLAAAGLLIGLTGGLTPWLADIGVSVRAALVGSGALIANSPVPTEALALGAMTTLLLSGGLLVWHQRSRRR